MAPHSSTLAWKLPWTEEPGRLQSMGSQRVGHDCATSLSLFTFLHWRRKWQPTPVFLPGESQGRGAWWAAIYGVTQSRTWLKWLSSSSRDIDYAVENNNIKYASYAFTPVVSGLKKKKSVYFPPSWVLVAGWPGCGEQGLLFSALLGLLSAVASLLQSSGSGARGLPQVRLPGSRLVALQLVESSQTTGQTHVSCISKPVLSLWATS